MSSRVKPYFIILCAILVAAFLLNSPVAFATKLPTACNIFDNKQIEKSGPCGQRALLSTDKSFTDEFLFSSGIHFSLNDCLLSQNIFSSVSTPSVTIPISAVPLRC
jgi:hypothetical protein